jgi:hypothetical protein
MLVRDSLPRIIGKSLAIAGTYEPKVARDASRSPAQIRPGRGCQPGQFTRDPCLLALEGSS